MYHVLYIIFSFALHFIPSDRLCVEQVRYIAENAIWRWSAAPSLILRTCLSYLTSNAHTHVRSSHRLSLSLLFYCSLVFVSDRRHLWPKICEESFCKTIFLPSFLPALLLSSSSSSYSSPSELHRRAFRVRSLSSAHGSIALSLKNENAAWSWARKVQW